MLRHVVALPVAEISAARLIGAAAVTRLTGAAAALAVTRLAGGGARWQTRAYCGIAQWPGLGGGSEAVVPLPIIIKGAEFANLDVQILRRIISHNFRLQAVKFKAVVFPRKKTPYSTADLRILFERNVTKSSCKCKLNMYIIFNKCSMCRGLSRRMHCTYLSSKWRPMYKSGIESKIML